MPLYQLRCADCNYETSVWRTVDNRNQDLPACARHEDHMMARVISAPYIAADITPYVSPATGKVINSRAQMRYDLESSGNIMNEPGLKQDIARHKLDVEEKTFAPVAAGIDQAVTQLVNAGKLEA